MLSVAVLVLGFFAGVMASLVTQGLLWSRGAFYFLTFLFLALPMTYIPGEILGRKLEWNGLKWFGAIALGWFSIAVPLAILGKLALWIHLPGLYVVTAFILGSLGLSVWALWNNWRLPKTVSMDLSFEKISRPLTLVQLSDIHLDGLVSANWVQKIVDQVNAVDADFVLFTGDLFDRHPDHLRPHLRALSGLKAKYGKLAVSGNHDFYSHYPHFQSILKDIGFELIDNQLIQMEGVQFVGIPDKQAVQFGAERRHVRDILALRDRQQLVVMLDHRPEDFEANVEAGIDFQLSGHTHWGQIPPWGLLVRLRYRYANGLKRFQESLIYTSKGTGTWGPPMRLFGRSEIVKIRLLPKAVG